MSGRRVCVCLLALCLLLTVCLPVTARAEDASASFADGEELAEIIENALAEQRLPGVEVSVAVRFTRTGEELFYRADQWYYSASLYKLPMIMRYSRLVEDGELGEVPAPFTEQAELIKERCLVYSDNSWASALWRHVFTVPGSMQTAALEYAHFPADEVPEDYYSVTRYSARFMLGIVKELYENPEEYPGVLDYMKQAQPGQYFRRELEGVYDAAQKYGSADGVNHAAGILWTPSPILLVVMSNGLGARLGDLMIGHVSAAIARYALTVDERADAWEARQAEIARAEAEAAAAAAAATPEPTPTPEPAPEPETEPEPEPVERGGVLWKVAVPLGAAGLLALLHWKKKGK